MWDNTTLEANDPGFFPSLIHNSPAYSQASCGLCLCLPCRRIHSGHWGSPNIGFWNLQNLEPPNIPEKFDYHDLSNQNGQFFGGTLQKFDGIQLAKRCLKRCCTMYRAKMCQPTYHTFRPLEYDGTYSTITCVVIGCFWLLTYQNHVSRQ